MSENEEIVKVMERIEGVEGTKSNVKGSMITQNREIIRTTFDNTTSQAIQQHILDGEINLKELCNNFVRAINPEDSLQFIRADYVEEGSDDRYQLIATTAGDKDTVVLQEYKIRDLRVRPKDQKDIGGYVHVQKDYFFPLIDKNAKVCMLEEKK